jgi:hypothetical protein
MQDASFLEVLFVLNICSEFFVLKHRIPRQIIFMKNIVNVMFLMHSGVDVSVLVINLLKPTGNFMYHQV